MNLRTLRAITGSATKPAVALAVILGAASLASFEVSASQPTSALASHKSAFGQGQNWGQGQGQNWGQGQNEQPSQSHQPSQMPSHSQKPGSGTPSSSTVGSTTVNLHNAGVSSSGVPNACSLSPESGGSANDWLFILTGLNGDVSVPSSVSITWQDNGTTSNADTFTTNVSLTAQDGHSGHYLIYQPGAAPIRGTATVSSNWSGEFVISGGPGCNSSVVANNSPSLHLTKTEAAGSPDPVTKVGQLVTYDFVVTNNGNVALTGLVVADVQAISGQTLTSGPTCTSSSLGVGASETCTGTLTVTSGDIADGEINDTAVAHAYDGTEVVTSNQATLTIPVVVPTTSSSSTTSGHPPTTGSSSSSGHSSTPTTSSSSTSPSPVRLVTGPSTPPSSTSPILPIGLAIAGLGLGGLGYVAIERKRLKSHGRTNEVG